MKSPSGTWLRHTFALQPVIRDRGLPIRAAVGMVLPLLIGLAYGHLVDGAVAALGAYGALVDDSSAPYRLRALCLIVPQGAGAVGLVLGSLAAGNHVAGVALAAGIALVSGLLSRFGRVSSLASLALLLDSVMGLTLPTIGAWWAIPVLFFVGGLPFMAMALLGWLWPARRVEQAAVAVADAYRAVARLLNSGSDSGKDPDSGGWRQARLATTQAMNHAYETLLVRRLRSPGAHSATAQLVHRLRALTLVIAAAPSLRTRPTRLPPDYADSLKTLADAIKSGRPVAMPPSLTAPNGTTQQALHTALVAVLRPAPDPVQVMTGAAFEAQSRLWPRLRSTCAELFGTAAAWHHALRLAACLGVAEVVASAVPLPRAAWIVLTVALVVYPDLGTVPARTALRMLGTVVGAILSWGALALFNDGACIAVIGLFAVLRQTYGLRGYFLQTLFLTPIMLLDFNLISSAGATLASARVLDTLIGCVVAVTIGYVIWPERWKDRLPNRLADLYDLIVSYAELERSSPREVQLLAEIRRRIYRQLAALYSELQRARTDPRRLPRVDDWHDLLAEAEDAIDLIGGMAAGRAHNMSSHRSGIDPVISQLRSQAQAIRARRLPDRGSRPDLLSGSPDP